MKRLIVAFVLLLTVTALCFVSLHLQKKDMQALLGMVDTMEKEQNEDNWSECVKISDQFVKEFDKRTRLFPFFMRHCDVNDIKAEVVTLPVLLKTGETEQFAAELAKCRSMLEKLSELETPTPENIL